MCKKKVEGVLYHLKRTKKEWYLKVRSPSWACFITPSPPTSLKPLSFLLCKGRTSAIIYFFSYSLKHLLLIARLFYSQPDSASKYIDGVRKGFSKGTRQRVAGRVKIIEVKNQQVWNFIFELAASYCVSTWWNISNQCLYAQQLSIKAAKIRFRISVIRSRVKHSVQNSTSKI